MAITLAQLCRGTERKYDLRVIAGREGMANVVRWVHMVEDIQVPEFLHGNELVFTTGIGHIGKNQLLEFVQKLKAHSAAGLVLNIGLYINEVPPEVIEYCKKERFPLFALPWRVYIIDITYDFCRRIIENEKVDVTAVEAFKNMIDNPEVKGDYAAILENLGFKSINRYRVITISFRRDKKDITEQLMNNAYMKLWSVLAHSKDMSVMFIQDEKLTVIRQNISDEAVEKILQRLGDLVSPQNIEYTAGISEDERGYLAVPQLFPEAEAAYTTAVYEKKKVLFYKNIGVNKLLFGIERTDILLKYTSEFVDEIYEYDKSNNTDFVEVLRQYLECDGSVKRVSELYGVHRNTVNGKIRQIKQLFNLELNGEEKTEIMLAFRIRDILKYINGGKEK